MSEEQDLVDFIGYKVSKKDSEEWKKYINQGLMNADDVQHIMSKRINGNENYNMVFIETKPIDESEISPIDDYDDGIDEDI